VPFGFDALIRNTTGYQNTAVGLAALVKNGGFQNTACGAESLLYNATGNSNTQSDIGLSSATARAA
jgi:hypothetical protein